MKNLIFNGWQERKEKTPLPMYTDKFTGTTFLICEGETLFEALKRKRIQFEKQEPLFCRSKEKLFQKRLMKKRLQFKVKGEIK